MFKSSICDGATITHHYQFLRHLVFEKLLSFNIFLEKLSLYKKFIMILFFRFGYDISKIFIKISIKKNNYGNAGSVIRSNNNFWNALKTIFLAMIPTQHLFYYGMERNDKRHHVIHIQKHT